MALMSPQAISSVITPSFAAPSVSDTITYTTGLILYVKNGATSTTVTIEVPGNQTYSGTAKADLTATFSSDERAFYISPEAVDTSTGLVTVTYSDVTTVTAALLKV